MNTQEKGGGFGVCVCVSGNYKHLVLVSGCGLKWDFLEILTFLLHVRSHLTEI